MWEHITNYNIFCYLVCETFWTRCFSDSHLKTPWLKYVTTHCITVNNTNALQGLHNLIGMASQFKIITPLGIQNPNTKTCTRLRFSKVSSLLIYLHTILWVFHVFETVVTFNTYQEAYMYSFYIKLNQLLGLS